MASRAQIASIARRIEALGAVDGQMHLVVVSPGETKEQALADYERWRGGPIRGQVYLVDTGVPRSPDWGKCQESR